MGGNTVIVFYKTGSTKTKKVFETMELICLVSLLKRMKKNYYKILHEKYITNSNVLKDGYLIYFR